MKQKMNSILDGLLVSFKLAWKRKLLKTASKVWAFENGAVAV